MVRMTTSAGDIDIALYTEDCPETTGNFLRLVDDEFYNGLHFHRVIKSFMIQGGCPLGTGTGGPGYRFEDEFDAELKHDSPGKLSMANAGPNTNGSQFFITYAKHPHLDNNCVLSLGARLHARACMHVRSC